MPVVPRIEIPPTGSFDARRYASSSRNVRVPYAIDWDDGSRIQRVLLFSNGGPPFRGTFNHTYVDSDTYLITVGDAVCCSDAASAVINTGTPYIQTGLQYVWQSNGAQPTFSTAGNTYPDYGSVVAILATASVSTGAGIPALNIYGLLAMAFVLVGAGLLVYRKPQQA